MVDKIILFVSLTALLAQGLHAATNVKEVELPEETINHTANPLLGRAITIPQAMWDTLMSCYVIFPDDQMFELHPNSNLDEDNIKPSTGSSLFKQCGIEFRGITEAQSGVYELISMVDHRNGEVSLTRKKFNMNFSVSEVETP